MEVERRGGADSLVTDGETALLFPNVFFSIVVKRQVSSLTFLREKKSFFSLFLSNTSVDRAPPAFAFSPPSLLRRSPNFYVYFVEYTKSREVIQKKKRVLGFIPFSNVYIQKL